MTTGPQTRRVRVYYSGNVQGVGFRYTTRQIAASYPITGYVRNLPDGRVELVAEGPADQLEKFLAAVADRMGAYIGQAQADWSEPTGQFTDFR